LIGVDMVHICGIALSLTDQTRNAVYTLAKLAHAKGIQVCFDFNFRMSLNTGNSHRAMKQRYEQILPYADVVFGSKRDLVELLDYPDRSDEECYAQFTADYHVTTFAGTRRTNDNQRKYFQGFMMHAGKLFQSHPREIRILDRIGSGDAFASGVITGLIEKWPIDKTLDFAVANSVLTQATLNDTPLFTQQDVFDYLASNGQNELIR